MKLNQDLLHLWFKFGDPRLNRLEIDAHRHTCNDNIWRPKLASGKKENMYRINIDGNEFEIFQSRGALWCVSCDSSPYGYWLLKLLANHDLLIANDRVCCDLSSKHTCCQRNGMSVVELLKLPEDLLNRFNYFKGSRLLLIQWSWMHSGWFINEYAFKI